MDFAGLIEKVKEFEGFRGTAYKCPAGKLTIGYGHTKDVKPGQKMSEAEATRILEDELYDIYEYILSASKGIYRFSENQTLALTSFCFNGGKGWYTQVTEHCTRSITEIAEHMLLYDKATINGSLIKLSGLTKRRQWEHDLFNTPDNCTTDDLRDAKVCFKHGDTWIYFDGKCTTIDGVDYAVCKFTDNREEILIPECKIEGLELPIKFIGI